MERIMGPVEGYYVASYAQEVSERPGQYLGYCKVCLQQPDSYWEARCCAKFSGDTTFSSPEAALANAEDVARMQVANQGGVWLMTMPSRYGLSFNGTRRIDLAV